MIPCKSMQRVLKALLRYTRATPIQIVHLGISHFVISFQLSYHPPFHYSPIDLDGIIDSRLS